MKQWSKRTTQMRIIWKTSLQTVDHQQKVVQQALQDHVETKASLD